MRASISQETPQWQGWQMGSAWGGGGLWIFYCFALCPDVKLYWGTRVGVHWLQTDCRGLFDFLDRKRQLITDLAVKVQRHWKHQFLLKQEGRSTGDCFLPFWWMSDQDPPTIKGSRMGICSQVYICQFPELIFLSLPIIWAIRPSDTCARSNQGGKLCNICPADLSKPRFLHL